MRGGPVMDEPRDEELGRELRAALRLREPLLAGGPPLRDRGRGGRRGGRALPGLAVLVVGGALIAVYLGNWRIGESGPPPGSPRPPASPSGGATPSPGTTGDLVISGIHFPAKIGGEPVLTVERALAVERESGPAAGRTILVAGFAWTFVPFCTMQTGNRSFLESCEASWIAGRATSPRWETLTAGTVSEGGVEGGSAIPFRWDPAFNQRSVGLGMIYGAGVFRGHFHDQRAAACSDVPRCESVFVIDDLAFRAQVPHPQPPSHRLQQLGRLRVPVPTGWWLATNEGDEGGWLLATDIARRGGAAYSLELRVSEEGLPGTPGDEPPAGTPLTPEFSRAVAIQPLLAAQIGSLPAASTVSRGDDRAEFLVFGTASRTYLAILHYPAPAEWGQWVTDQALLDFRAILENIVPDEAPRAPISATFGVPYPYQLERCGLFGPILFDGSSWRVMAARGGDGGPFGPGQGFVWQTFLLIGAASGTITVLDRETAEFRTTSGVIVTLRRHEGTAEPLSCP